MTVAFEPIVRITSPTESLIKVVYPQAYTNGATLRHSKYFSADKKGDARNFAKNLRGPNGEEMEITSDVDGLFDGVASEN